MSKRPTLYFTPDTWAKLIHLRDKGNTEIAGCGVTLDPNDMFTVNEFYMLPQECSGATFEFDDHALAIFADQMLGERELPMAQTCRILTHTHPGNSATPSQTDEKEFAQMFSSADHGIMMILANGGATYARVKINKPVLPRTPMK